MDQAQQIKKRLAELQNRGTFGGYTVYTDFLGLEEQSLLAEVTGCSRTYRKCRNTAFKCCNSLLEDILCRIGQTSVNISGIL